MTARDRARHLAYRFAIEACFERAAEVMTKEILAAEQGAVEQEREACAEIAKVAAALWKSHTANEIGAAIRARGKK